MTTRKFLKFDRWWASHFGMMMAFVYLVLAIAPSPPPVSEFLKALALFIVACSGIATFGFMLNDLTDVDQDVRNGAYNLFAKTGTGLRAAWLAGALLAGIAPWWWLPTTPCVAALVAAEFVLFILYSVSPFRLKERGILGSIADALYAYVIPNAFAVLVFAEFCGYSVPHWLIAAILVWCFCFGIGRILHHQLLDADSDEKECVRTFVVRFGWADAFHFLFAFVTPLVALAFVVLLALWSTISPIVPLGFAVHAVFVLIVWSRSGLGNATGLRAMPATAVYHVVAERVVATFIWRWFALLSLVALVIACPRFLPLIPLHLALFPSGVLWGLRHGIPETWQLLRSTRFQRTNQSRIP